MGTKKITLQNLDQKQFTNKEVLEMIKDLSLKLDQSGYYRALDLVEGLTDDRHFEIPENYISKKENVVQKIISALVEEDLLDDKREGDDSEVWEKVRTTIEEDDKERDNRDLAICVLEVLVEAGLVPDCTDTDDSTEFDVQDAIQVVLDIEFPLNIAED